MLCLPHEDTVIETGDKVNRYNYIINASYVMKEPSPSISYLFTAGYIHSESRMTQYVINHILFPIKSNFNLITQVDVEVIWLVKKKVKVNWAQQVVDYMMDNK